MLTTDRLLAHGELTLTIKETGKILCKKNLVVENSSHITALGLGGDIGQRVVKVGTWGDKTPEEPSKSIYSMTNLECLEHPHASDGNHTTQSFVLTSHVYPAYKSIKFSFQFDRWSAPNLIGKNLQEFGLFFNNILFSRVALEESNVFENWMTVIGEWTIIFMYCSSGNSNYNLNQYALTSVWTMDEVVDGTTITDYAGKNNLTSILPPARLISNLIGSDPNVSPSDYIHRDSLCSFYEETNLPNVLGITTNDIYRHTLDLKDRFTLWQWFKFKDINSTPFSLDRGGEWVLMSKWATNGATNSKSYRLYISRTASDNPLDQTYLNFDINDGGTIKTITSSPLNVDILSENNILNVWCLAIVTLNMTTQKLELYFNNNMVASTTLVNFGTTPPNQTSFMIGTQQLNSDTDLNVDTTKVFKGFIDETAISPELFSANAISLLWNNGYGNFYNP